MMTVERTNASTEVWHPREQADFAQLATHAIGGHRCHPSRDCPACWTLDDHVRERCARLWAGARGRHEHERQLVLDSLVRRGA